MNLDESQLCSQCGVARDRVQLNHDDICSACEYHIRRLVLTETIRRLTVDRAYFGPGLYAVYFEKGVKIGISKNVQNRLRTYQHQWCYPILGVQVIGLPVEALTVLEKVALRSLPHVGRHGEFFYGAGPVEVTHILETVVLAQFGRLSKYDPWDEGLSLSK